MAVIFEWGDANSRIYADACVVRRAVFVAEQGFSEDGEFDDTDAVALHLAGYESGSTVCAARLYFDEDGAARFGRLAVLPVARGRGLGLAMMAKLEAKALEQGAAAAALNAQADKAAFYEKAGFAATGHTSLDEGVPHVMMEKKLR